MGGVGVHTEGDSAEEAEEEEEGDEFITSGDWRGKQGGREVDLES